MRFKTGTVNSGSDGREKWLTPSQQGKDVPDML